MNEHIQSSRKRSRRRTSPARKIVWGVAASLVLLLLSTKLPEGAPRDPQVVVIPVEGLH